MTLTEYLGLQYGLLKRLVSGRDALSVSDRSVVAEFHKLYYEKADVGGTWQDTYWMGCKILKCPLDLWVYQEILHETKPDLVIETGTYNGGSASYIAAIMDILGTGQIVTVDVDVHAHRPAHPRIRYLHGASTDPAIVSQMTTLAAGKSVMVILDSDHSRDNVLRELDVYAPLVTSGHYLIVEDSNVNGHPTSPDHGPGPMEAIDDFLVGNPSFRLDDRREKFLMTLNPRGYWRRV
jgi:cephalosporin hydroxylase